MTPEQVCPPPRGVAKNLLLHYGISCPVSHYRRFRLGQRYYCERLRFLCVDDAKDGWLAVLIGFGDRRGREWVFSHADLREGRFVEAADYEAATGAMTQ